MPTYDVRSWFDDPRSSGSTVYRGIVAKSERDAISKARKLATDDGTLAMHKRGSARFEVVAKH